MKWLEWFIAGALAVPLGHHVVLALLNAFGLTTYRPYSFEPTKPFGVPAFYRWIERWRATSASSRA